MNFFCKIFVLPSLFNITGLNPLCIGRLKDGSETECPSRHPPFLGPLPHLYFYIFLNWFDISYSTTSKRNG